MDNKYPSVSKQIKLNNDYVLSIDQSIGEDKTCLCFYKSKNNKFALKGIKYIEKQEDIDKYINMNMGEIYRTFGLSLEELGGEN